MLLAATEPLNLFSQLPLQLFLAAMYPSPSQVGTVNTFTESSLLGQFDSELWASGTHWSPGDLIITAPRTH